MVLDEYQIETLEEILEDMEHIAEHGALMISGMMCREYSSRAETLKEIIEEAKE